MSSAARTPCSVSLTAPQRWRARGATGAAAGEGVTAAAPAAATARGVRVVPLVGPAASMGRKDEEDGGAVAEGSGTVGENEVKRRRAPPPIVVAGEIAAAAAADAPPAIAAPAAAVVSRGQRKLRCRNKWMDGWMNIRML